jgi:hypothetical protein
MSESDSYSRDQLRRTYADAWRKRTESLPLTPLEALITDVIGVHPEYQTLVSDVEAAMAFEPSDPGAVHNPFLHMGLHLAIREQVSIDRPPGVRELHRQLHAHYGNLHQAEHVLMDALGEVLWEAQRSGRPPDEGGYLALARRALETPG